MHIQPFKLTLTAKQCALLFTADQSVLIRQERDTQPNGRKLQTPYELGQYH